MGGAAKEIRKFIDYFKVYKYITLKGIEMEAAR